MITLMIAALLLALTIIPIHIRIQVYIYVPQVYSIFGSIVEPKF